MTAYAIRVDFIGTDMHERMDKFLSIYDRYLVYEEVGTETGKLHYQGVVYHAGSETAIRTRWTECFPSDPWEAKRAKKKSCTKVRSEKYEIYITKENNIQFKKGYTEEEINNLYKQSYKKEKEDIIKKVDKPTFQAIVVARFDEAVAKIGTENWVIGPRKISRVQDITRDSLIDWLVDTFACLRKLWDTPVIVKYANFLHYRIDPEGHKQAFRMACRERW